MTTAERRAEEDFTKAAELQFRRASALVPDNLAVALRLGAILERENRYVEALVVYLGFKRRWKRVFEVRYRIAATLAMSESWLASVALNGVDDRHRLARLLEGQGYDTAATAIEEPDISTLNDALLAAAKLEWSELARYLGACWSTRRFLGSVVRRKAEWNDASYQRRFVRLDRARFERVHAVAIARLVTDIQLLTPWPRPFGATGDRLNECASIRGLVDAAAGSSAICAYNRACCYARLYELTGADDDVASAIAHLQDAVRTGSAARWITSIAKDPDLVALRRTQRFRQWWEDLNQGSGTVTAKLWAIELAQALADRWNTVYALTPRALGTANGAAQSDSDQSAAVNDDACFTTLRQWIASDSVEHSAQLGVELASLGAALHVRVPLPPPIDEESRTKWKQPTANPAGRMQNVVDRLEVASQFQEVEPLPGERRERWLRTAELLRGEPPEALITDRV